MYIDPGGFWLTLGDSTGLRLFSKWKKVTPGRHDRTAKSRAYLCEKSRQCARYVERKRWPGASVRGVEAWSGCLSIGALEARGGGVRLSCAAQRVGETDGAGSSAAAGAGIHVR